MRRTLMLVFCLAVLLRLGYGIARFHNVLNVSGTSFIMLWDYDALEHILIAKSIISGQGYVVASEPAVPGKQVRARGMPALFKAPLYQYFLACLFLGSGFSFNLLLPVQAVLGGLLSTLIAAVSDRVFGGRAGLFAGIAAAGHPILINTASQPYNENLYFCLFSATLFLFILWLRKPTFVRAAVCGVLVGATALTRESMLAPFIAMVVFALFTAWRERRLTILFGIALMALTAALSIAPWTIHNYRTLGVFLPISSISGSVFGAGNNECIAAVSLLTAFYGDDPCPSLDQRRALLRATLPQEPAVYWNDRVYARLGMQFVTQYPAAYLRVCLQRAWTTFLPYHPRQALGAGRKVVVTVYYLIVLAPGLIGAIASLARGPSKEGGFLLLCAAFTVLPLIAVFVSHDGRFRVGLDLILGCYAGYFWDQIICFADRHDSEESNRRSAARATVSRAAWH